MRPRAWLDENRKRTGVFGTALRVPLMLAVFANLLSSCAVVLVNKWLVAQHRFDHIIFLTSCQMAFTAAGMRVMLRCGVFAYKACERRTVVRVAGASLLAMAFMNLNLKQNSVGFFQMTKLACIPCTLATQYLAGDRFPDGATLATLVPLVGGLYVAEVHDHTVTPLGTLYGAVAVVATVLAQRATASSQRRLRVDSNQLLYHTSPLIALAMLAASPLCDDVAHLAALDWTADLGGDVLWSCALALAANVSNYYVLGRTSPLTYQVLGHVKTIATIGFSVVVFGLETNAKNLLGLFVAMVGVVSYTEVTRRASVARERRRLRDEPTEAAPAPAVAPREGRPKRPDLRAPASPTSPALLPA